MTTRPLLTLRPVGHCAGSGCTSMLLAKDTWSSFTKDERRHLAVIFARHQGRRLCSACWEKAAKVGAIIDHEPVHQSAAWRTDDYQTMRDELPSAEHASAHARLRAAAERIGCHPDTIKRALRLNGITP